MAKKKKRVSKVKKTINKIFKKEVKEPKVNTDSTIDRGSYLIKFVKPEDEKGRNDLRGTGLKIGEVAIDNNTSGDGIDEIAVFIKK